MPDVLRASTNPPESCTVLLETRAPTPKPSSVAVLVVDNEPPIAMVIRRVLGPGHDITAREDAAEACRLVREGAEFDVILCDLLMPGMSGEQFYDVLARLAPHLKKRVVFMSGATTLPDSRAFLGRVGNAVLDKPFTSAALRDAVRAIVTLGRGDHA